MPVDLERTLENLLRSLDPSSNLIFFPIRHHSPACAWHIQQLIKTAKPTAILIEGAEDMNDLIPFILHPQSKAPFAVYTTYIDTAKRLGESAEPLRFAGYYPFCDYSPELVALRTGQEVNAKLQFIDLNFAEKSSYITPDSGDRQGIQTKALLEESYFKRSAYVAALAKKTGCRDADELWDHLFEVNFQGISTAKFIQNVAAYCHMARLDSPPQLLEVDGTIARERAMVAAIHVAVTNEAKVLVITGGFHTVVLPFLLQEAMQKPLQKLRKLKLKPEQGQTVLMRYSFEQLNALNGYAAGMPAPEFYQRLWAELQKGTESPLLAAVNQILVEVGHKSRASGIGLSTADAIAALEQARRLANFRNHQAPTREDLLDGIRSCFIKGDMDGEGAMLMTLVRKMLGGDRIGDLPDGVGVPPIVQDFRQIAAQLRLKINTSLPQSLTLEIYRKVNHRRASRFLYILEFLNIPFARVIAAPDFVKGKQLDRLQEIWEYRWLPQTESSLIERSLYGTTLEEAAVTVLQQKISKLETAGKSRSAVEVVQILISACRMGLHAYTGRLLAIIALNISEDPAFISLVDALGQLVLLWQSREPLEAHNLVQIPELSAIAYQRLCYLLPNLATCPEPEVNDILDRFGTIREFLATSAEFDPELFYAGLQSLLAQGHTMIVGGAAGILYSAGRLGEIEIVNLAIANLNSTTGNQTQQISQGAGFLRGLLHTAREVAWNVSKLLQAIDAQLQVWDDEQFLRLLPDFRLAFADLTPRETDKVASLIAGFYGKPNLGDLTNRHLTQADLHLGLQLEQLLVASLKADNLDNWAET
jgi:hypothetical protein